MSAQFNDEKVLLFCSEKCKKKYFKAKLERIKVSYPKYYEKVLKSLKKKDGWWFELSERKETEDE